MATAGTPPSAKPSSARRRRNTGQLGAKAATMLSPEAASSETIMTDLRPRRSERLAAATIESARAAVLNEMLSELAGASILKTRAKVGKRGWGQ